MPRNPTITLPDAMRPCWGDRKNPKQRLYKDPADSPRFWKGAPVLFTIFLLFKNTKKETQDEQKGTQLADHIKLHLAQQSHANTNKQTLKALSRQNF